MKYFLAALMAAVISFGLSPLVKRLAKVIGAVDEPTGGRKIHTRPTPRLGGVAIAIGFLIPALIFVHPSRHFAALLLAATILVVVGVIDDRKSLSPWAKLFWQVTAAAVALAGGIGITAISQPFGHPLDISWGRLLVNFGPLHFHVLPIANLLSIVWIVGLVNAVNFLDGIDGLACGVSSIASFFLFVLALSVHQPEVAIIAIVLFGASLGFLPFNFFPAKMFLGDSGAYFLGLVLALVAIYSGGKLATAALVLGFTIVDGLITVLRRLYHRRSPFRADRSHLHHLLLDVGFTQRQTVALYYLMAILLGTLALHSGTLVKIVTIVLLTIVTSLVVAILIRWSARQPVSKP